MCSAKQDVQPEIIIQDNDPSIIYTGNWTRYTGRAYSDDGASMALYDNGKYFEYTFTGSGIGYYSEGNTDQGEIDFYLDGVLHGTATTKTSTRQYSDLIYYITDISPGEHTFKGVKKNGSWMLLDQLKVYNDAALTAEVEQFLGAGSEGTARLQFNQSLDSQSGTEPGNYQLNNGASVVSVTLSNDRKTADLTITGLTTQTDYTLTLSQISNQILTNTVQKPDLYAKLHCTSCGTGL